MSPYLAWVAIFKKLYVVLFVDQRYDFDYKSVTSLVQVPVVTATPEPTAGRLLEDCRAWVKKHDLCQKEEKRMRRKEEEKAEEGG